MDKFTITTELTNRVLAYLGSKPYAETHELIEAIQREYQLEESRSRSMFADVKEVDFKDDNYEESDQEKFSKHSLTSQASKAKKAKNIE